MIQTMLHILGAIDVWIAIVAFDTRSFFCAS